MNAAFRSHLMQQFAAQARTQSRPPLALLGLLTEDTTHSTANNSNSDGSTSPWQRQDGSERFRHLSSIETSTKSSVNLRRRHTDSDIFQSSSAAGASSLSGFPKQFSTTRVNPPQEGDEEDSLDVSNYDSSKLQGQVNLSLMFQHLLQTRRTSSRLLALTAETPVTAEWEYWQAATERAVTCGYQAPNHKRTEPFTFKRMIAPSERTERLAEIAYRVALQQGKTQESSSAAASPAANQELQTELEQKAARKREKWLQIPAFLVATVQEEEPLFDLDSAALHPNEYDPLAYVPPSTERALENYASACAAVQNVLLSLHAEDIATKWATGPVIRTPAFRELIQAHDNERIVALIMVGQGNRIPKRPRRNRRPLRSGAANDVLVDL